MPKIHMPPQSMPCPLLFTSALPPAFSDHPDDDSLPPSDDVRLSFQLALQTAIDELVQEYGLSLSHSSNRPL